MALRAVDRELSSDSVREPFKPVSASISEVDENEDDERDAEVRPVPVTYLGPI